MPDLDPKVGQGRQFLASPFAHISIEMGLTQGWCKEGSAPPLPPAWPRQGSQQASVQANIGMLGEGR